MVESVEVERRVLSRASLRAADGAVVLEYPWQLKDEDTQTSGADKLVFRLELVGMEAALRHRGTVGDIAPALPQGRRASAKKRVKHARLGIDQRYFKGELLAENCATTRAAKNFLGIGQWDAP